jgi:hypothetical protein
MSNQNFDVEQTVSAIIDNAVGCKFAIKQLAAENGQLRKLNLALQETVKKYEAEKVEAVANAVEKKPDKKTTKKKEQ